MSNHPVTQMLRCYLEPAPAYSSPSDEGDNPSRKRKRDAGEYKLQQHELDAIVRRVGPNWYPWGGPTLIFDTETTTDMRQIIRFGVYQLRGNDFHSLMELAKRFNRNLSRDQLDALSTEGIVYNPDPYICNKEEISTMQAYADKHKLAFITLSEFIHDVFYKVYSLKAQKWVVKDGIKQPNDALPCMIVGHNLPFDIGGMARDASPSRDDNYGGLTLKLRDYGPHVTIKKIGFAKHMYGTHLKFGRVNHLFVNTQQLGRALFGASVKSSLAGMAEALGLKDVKGSADYDGPITTEYIEYCRNDVNLTWQVYKGLRGLYMKHGFTALNSKGQLSRPIDKIYSEASIGKGYLEQLGILPFKDKNPGWDHANHTAPFMAAMYGRRSEVRWRLEIRQGMQADFKSQYPTNNALQKLQELDVAEKIKVVSGYNGGGEAADFLRSVTLDDLQNRDTWPKLRGAALIDPSDCVLPVRTIYQTHLDQDENAKAQQIGINKIETAPLCWYSFADIIASKLSNGHCPKIFQTITLIPETYGDWIMGSGRYYDVYGSERTYEKMLALFVTDSYPSVPPFRLVLFGFAWNECAQWLNPSPGAEPRLPIRTRSEIDA